MSDKHTHPSAQFAPLVLGCRTTNDCLSLAKAIWDAAQKQKHEHQRTEIRLDPSGALDEVVGIGAFTLEQMDERSWWMLLGGVHVWLTAKGRKITAHYEDERDE